jgi:3-hydroxyisobutyrate dehydrogenase
LTTEKEEEHMAKLAFIGLGQMGAPMAARLVDAGHDVTVWNRSIEKTEPLRARGAAVAATPADAAAGGEAAITMLADPTALDEVVFGEEGAAIGLGPGSTLIEMSTVGPDAIRRLAERLPDGVGVLDAPVRGSVGAATEGTLRIVVGGPEDQYERWRPVLEVLGEPTRMGPLGAGAAAKLVNNLAGVASTAVLAEALALADRLGLGDAETIEMLATSPLASAVQNVRERIENEDFRPQFRAALAAKDLRLAEAAAEGQQLVLRVAPAARTWFEDASAAGLGDLDWSVVTALARGRSVSRS